jgi:tetratricopeptide (TPR) repeat protein
MLWRLGRTQEADRELAAAAQLAPRNAAILGTYALLLLKQGRGTEAEQALLACIRHNTGVWVFARLYGNLLLMQNRLPEAVRAFREAERLGANDPAFRFDYARALAQTNQLEDADEQFRLAVRAETGTGRARARYGAFLLERGRFDEAEEQLKQAILWPESQTAYQYLAQLYLKERRLDEVPPHLQMALQVDPDSVAARESRAELLLLRGQAVEALAALQQLVDESVSRGTTHLLRGGALRALNRQLESETALREAQRADPALARTLLRHARALRTLGYYNAALECVGQSLALAPDQPEALAENQAIRAEQANRPVSRRPDRRP